MLRQGSWEDFAAAAALEGDEDLLRRRWQVPSSDPSRGVLVGVYTIRRARFVCTNESECVS